MLHTVAINPIRLGATSGSQQKGSVFFRTQYRLRRGSKPVKGTTRPSTKSGDVKRMGIISRIKAWMDSGRLVKERKEEGGIYIQIHTLVCVHTLYEFISFSSTKYEQLFSHKRTQRSSQSFTNRLSWGVYVQILWSSSIQGKSLDDVLSRCSSWVLYRRRLAYSAAAVEKATIEGSAMSK